MIQREDMLSNWRDLNENHFKPEQLEHADEYATVSLRQFKSWWNVLVIRTTAVDPYGPYPKQEE